MSRDNHYCPLMEMEIDDGICFDIHMVVEDMAPDWTAPDKAQSREDFKEVCLKCEYHVYD